MMGRTHFEPHGQKRVVAEEFHLDGRRDEDFGEKLPEQFSPPDFQ